MPRNTCGVFEMSKEDKERERKYRAENDFRTLNEAAEIHSDKDRVAAVKEMHVQHGEMLKKIFGGMKEEKEDK